MAHSLTMRSQARNHPTYDRIFKLLTLCAMCNFIEDYLKDPSQAVAAARMIADERFCGMNCPNDEIYSQLSSPEYRLYEQIMLS